MTTIFGPALEAMVKSGGEWLPPQSFKDYAAKHGLGAVKTADKISVQSIGGLDRELCKEKVMVFRLGAASGGTTYFALARGEHSVDEYFLVDAKTEQGSEASQVERYVPEVSSTELFPFEFLGTLTETGAVNLALASGLLGHALGCERPSPRVAPATGRSTYDFTVRPSRRLPMVAWEHVGGQVEVDALFFGRRDGRHTLFVIESKHGPPTENTGLSKTKLAYPCSVVQPRAHAAKLTVVPVYLRSWVTGSGQRVRFRVKECRPWETNSFVTDVEVVSSRLYEMELGAAFTPP